MLFSLLQDRLVVHIRNRVRAGEITERSLAKLTGMSQPHLHNVLKGIRSLSSNYADQIVDHLHLSIADLLTGAEIGVGGLRGGPLARANGVVTTVDGVPQMDSQNIYPMPRWLTEQLIRPVMVKLEHDASLYPYFQEGDLALMDRAPLTREALLATSIYLVQTSRGTLVRLVRAGGTRLYLATPGNTGEPRQWDYVPLPRQDVREVIQGRLVWIGRALEPDSFALSTIFPQA